MADYLAIATINLLVGFEMAFLGFLNLDGVQDEAVEVCLIVAVLLAVATSVLIILIKAGDLAGNMVALCCVIGLSLFAGKCKHRVIMRVIIGTSR